MKIIVAKDYGRTRVQYYDTSQKNYYTLDQIVEALLKDSVALIIQKVTE